MKRIMSRTRTIILAIIVLYALCSMLRAVPAQAQFAPIQPGLMEDITGLAQQAAGIGLGEDLIAAVDLRVYALQLVRGALSLAGLVFLIFIIYGGASYMGSLKSGTGKEAVGSAKKILARATIGMAIILCSYGIVFFINRSLQRAIFQEMLVQMQNCQTQNGPSTCCREWADFQNAVTTIPRFGQGFVEGFEQGSATSDELYRSWQQCQSRANEQVGLPTNLF